MKKYPVLLKGRRVGRINRLRPLKQQITAGTQVAKEEARPGRDCREAAK